MVELPSSGFAMTPCTVHHLIRFEGLHRDTMCYNSFEAMGGSFQTHTVSKEMQYMVSPQTHYLVTPPCKPSNLIRWCTVHAWCHRYLVTPPCKPSNLIRWCSVHGVTAFQQYTWYFHHANLQILWCTVHGVLLHVTLQSVRSVAVSASVYLLRMHSRLGYEYLMRLTNVFSKFIFLYLCL